MFEILSFSISLLFGKCIWSYRRMMHGMHYGFSIEIMYAKWFWIAVLAHDKLDARSRAQSHTHTYTNKHTISKTIQTETTKQQNFNFICTKTNAIICNCHNGMHRDVSHSSCAWGFCLAKLFMNNNHCCWACVFFFGTWNQFYFVIITMYRCKNTRF